MGTYRHRNGLARACLLVAVAALAVGLLALTRAGAAGAELNTERAIAAKVPPRLVAERLSRAVASKPKPRPARGSEAGVDDQGPGGLPQVENAAGEPLSVTGDCSASLALAADQGLRLPDGWDIRCVGPGLDWEGNSHWGVTCP